MQIWSYVEQPSMSRILPIKQGFFDQWVVGQNIVTSDALAPVCMQKHMCTLDYKTCDK